MPISVAIMSGTALVASASVGFVFAFSGASFSNKSLNPAKWAWKRPKTYFAIFDGFAKGFEIRTMITEISTSAKSSTNQLKKFYLPLSIIGAIGFAYHKGAMANEGNLVFWEWKWDEEEAAVSVSEMVFGFGSAISEFNTVVVKSTENIPQNSNSEKPTKDKTISQKPSQNRKTVVELRTSPSTGLKIKNHGLKEAKTKRSIKFSDKKHNLLASSPKVMETKTVSKFSKDKQFFDIRHNEAFGSNSSTFNILDIGDQWMQQTDTAGNLTMLSLIVDKFFKAKKTQKWEQKPKTDVENLLMTSEIVNEFIEKLLETAENCGASNFAINEILENSINFSILGQKVQREIVWKDFPAVLELLMKDVVEKSLLILGNNLSESELSNLKRTMVFELKNVERKLEKFQERTHKVL